MESIIFDYIGYVLVFCAAFCLVAPVVVYLVSLVVGIVWKVVDEGDSEAPDLLKRVIPFLFSNGVERIDDGKWAVRKVIRFRVYIYANHNNVFIIICTMSSVFTLESKRLQES